MDNVNLIVAQNAMSELNVANKSLPNWHYALMGLSLVLLTTFFVIKRLCGIEIPELPLFSTLSLIGSVGIGVKQSAMVKRQYAVYEAYLPGTNLNPGVLSKLIMIIGNLCGSIIPILVLQTFSSAAQFNLVEPKYLITHKFCLYVMGLGFLAYLIAEISPPKFKAIETRTFGPYT